jgi:hypothetical protein
MEFPLYYLFILYYLFYFFSNVPFNVFQIFYYFFSGICFIRLVIFIQVYNMCRIPISSSQRSQTPSIAALIFACQFGVYVCVVIILFTVLVSTLDRFVFLYQVPVRFSAPLRNRPSLSPPPSACDQLFHSSRCVCSCILYASLSCTE